MNKASGAPRLDTVGSETSEPAVTVRDLHKRYGGVAAVNGLDLDIGRGEIFALLGPNGAGKTTTVEILEGFRHRDRGTVAVLGHDPGEPSRAWRARIGIVLQLASAGPELTVMEMVRHFAGLYPRSRDPQEAIELVGLTAKARSRIGGLSGGQARRLDVALGIVGRPELLFLDEPTTGFDPEARRQFWDLIRSLRTDGTTIVLTTHYLDEAEALADRIAVIAAGRIVATGDPGSLGGRSSAATRVSWATKAEAKAKTEAKTEAEAQAGAAAETQGDARPPAPRTSVETTTPTRLIAELSSQFGGEIPGLMVTRPTLEDTYLELIAQVTP
jgi:ABC-2 type transport system ATP-binding protein